MDGSNSGAAGAVTSTAGDGKVDTAVVSGGGVPPTITSSIVPAGDENQQTTSVRVDPITALQDSIDSLSLSMFEALRGLRDAVAPESGNLGGGQNNNDGNGKANNNNNNSREVENSSYEEFWQACRNGDPDVVATVNRLSPNAKPTKTADYIRIHSRLEIEKDAVLVAKLARTVLEKSAIIDDRVSTLPGMNRTKDQQFAYIQELIEKNNDASKRLEVAYTQAHQQRDEIRNHIMNHTSTSLGIFEEVDDDDKDDDDDENNNQHQ